jgi:pimeloyl-ACP methyl ester carboxylesterase
MGGYVALEVARRAPERIEALILANTNARADSEERKAGRLQRIALGPEPYYADLDNIQSYKDGISPAHINDKQLIARLKRITLDSGFDCFVRHQHACMNRRASLDILPGLKMPVLIWGGSDDKIIPVENQQEIAALVPQARLEIFPDTAHCTHLENPEGVTALLKEFLELDVQRHYERRKG